MRRMVLAALTALTAMLAAGAAEAQTGFRVCNKTSWDLEVAKGLNTSTAGQAASIVSEGWYKFAPGECATLWSGKLEYRYYLIFAQAPSVDREWKGNVSVCVARQAFTIKSGICDASLNRRMFFEVDTGDSEGWTHNQIGRASCRERV